MLPSSDWMRTTDVVILWFLSEHRWRFAAPPATVALNCGLSQSHTNQRIKYLKEAGLVELVDDRGYYRITDAGVQFVLGNLTAEDLEEMDPGDVA